MTVNFSSMNLLLEISFHQYMKDCFLCIFSAYVNDIHVCQGLLLDNHNVFFGRGVLKQQQKSVEWGSEVRDILGEGINKPRKGNDAGDHPPITPMKLASRNDLDGDAWKLYDYITRHFIATVRQLSHMVLNLFVA
jgi:hypothetical protein